MHPHVNTVSFIIVTKQVLHLKFKTVSFPPSGKGKVIKCDFYEITGLFFFIILPMKQWGPKFTSLFFFSILFFIKNVISNLMDICKTIQ